MNISTAVKKLTTIIKQASGELKKMKDNLKKLKKLEQKQKIAKKKADLATATMLSHPVTPRLSRGPVFKTQTPQQVRGDRIECRGHSIKDFNTK
jgi:hypothetical protein